MMIDATDVGLYPLLNLYVIAGLCISGVSVAEEFAMTKKPEIVVKQMYYVAETLEKLE